MVLMLFLLGLFIGSFLNVLADRLPRGESVLWVRSHCEHCKHTLAWYDLIPIVSYLQLRGACRYCRQGFSSQYVFAELACGIMFVALYVFFPLSSLSAYVFRMTICCCLFVIVLADIRYHIIPDEMIIALFILTILSVFVLPSDITPLSRVFAMGVMLLLFGGLVLITRGKGMGLGDVKYAAWMGFFLGLSRSAVAFYLAFLTGAALSLILISWRGRSLKSAIAFGPFLVFGTLVAWWYGDFVWHWFWNTAQYI